VDDALSVRGFLVIKKEKKEKKECGGGMDGNAWVGISANVPFEGRIRCDIIHCITFDSAFFVCE